MRLTVRGLCLSMTMFLLGAAAVAGALSACLLLCGVQSATLCLESYRVVCHMWFALYLHMMRVVGFGTLGVALIPAYLVASTDLHSMSQALQIFTCSQHLPGSCQLVSQLACLQPSFIPKVSSVAAQTRTVHTYFQHVHVLPLKPSQHHPRQFGLGYGYVCVCYVLFMLT
jgi:hypothetical protein